MQPVRAGPAQRAIQGVPVPCDKIPRIDGDDSDWASYLRAFRLMPLEPEHRKPIDAAWTFKVLDPTRRLVAFQDDSTGEIRSWAWDFGDGTKSTEQHPLHTYRAAGDHVVVLTVTGPAGSSRLSKVWDVSLP